MTVEKVFFIYMALVGVVVGAVLVAAPGVQDFLLKPYFWILLAVVLFDIGRFFLRARSPGPTLLMPTRLVGFAIGVLLMMAIPTLAGSSVKFF